MAVRKTQSKKTQTGRKPDTQAGTAKGEKTVKGELSEDQLDEAVGGGDLTFTHPQDSSSSKPF